MPLPNESRLSYGSPSLTALVFAIFLASKAFCPASFAQGNSSNPVAFRFVYNRAWTIPLTMHAPIYRNIYTVTSDGGKEGQLTADNQSFGAVLSPDGSKIAFIHLKPESCTNCFYPAEYELYVMNADGTDAGLVAAIDKPVEISWSPDSKMLAYGGFPVLRNPQMNSLPESSIRAEMDVFDATESPLYLLRLDKVAAPQRLSDKAMGPFRWSPDGNSVAFGCLDPSAVRESRSHICFTGTGQQAAVRILSENALPAEFSWSPDSTHLAYFGSNKGIYTLYVVGIDASAPRSLTELKGPRSGPQWSRDGREIIFSGIENKKSVVLTVNSDGSGKKSLTEPKLNASSPMWSPDGKQVLFTATLHDNPQAYLMNTDGSQIRALTHDGKLGCRNVAWLEESSLILLSCGPPSSASFRETDHESLFLLDANALSSRPRQLTHDGDEGISFAPITASRRDSAR